MPDIKNIEEIKEYPLSDDDIHKYLPSAKIILYNELQTYDDIRQLLPNPGDYFIFLYQDSPNSGHWCCVIRHKNEIEFFDPYGKYPDSELKWVSADVRGGLGIHDRYLTKLFDVCPFNIVYNDEDYQQEKEGVNTCGRHVVYRCMNKKLSLEQYHKLMKDQKNKGCNFDCVVTNNVNVH